MIQWRSEDKLKLTTCTFNDFRSYKKLLLGLHARDILSSHTVAQIRVRLDVVHRTNGRAWFLCEGVQSGSMITKRRLPHLKSNCHKDAVGSSQANTVGFDIFIQVIPAKTKTLVLTRHLGRQKDFTAQNQPNTLMNSLSLQVNADSLSQVFIILPVLILIFH